MTQPRMYPDVNDILYTATHDEKPISVGQATTKELLSIPGVPEHAFVDKLEKWSPIAIRHALDPKVKIHALGWRTKLKCAWITSPIIEINFDRKTIITKSGNFYRLGIRDDMTLNDELRRHLVSTLAGWGLAKIAERSY